ncbi:efflux RND transporter permease subunit [Marinomonas sp. PE14-40]|uniref:efflux RND transporter permease subunit n=1 Tax=Marinomonas sp. PE14-40 TaxID=3060621 RepID=UPI003F66954A
MLKYMTGHPTAANLLMLVLFFIGLLALPNLERETFPEIKSHEVTVTIAYPGASPDDVERSVCQVIEEATDGINFTQEKRCQAKSNQAILTLKMQENGNFSQFIEDINSAIDSVDNLPQQSESPIIEEVGRTEQVVSIALLADMPSIELKSLAEHLKSDIMSSTPISLIEIEGFSQTQFQVDVPLSNLYQYGLSIDQISNKLGEQSIDLPGGDISGKEVEYLVRFNDERRSIEALEDILILQGEDNTEIRLKDIANISRGFEEAENKVEFNGKPAALLVISKNSSDDSLVIFDHVKNYLENAKKTLPAEVSLEITNNNTSLISDRLNLLLKNAWQGLILVFVVMWLFFGTRYAFWVVAGLPVSFLASALVFSLLGISINMISMVALLLALGLLMDDAIVISESIGSKLKQGKSPLNAAVEGVQQVSKGVFSSFLTTICVFSGLLVMEGDIGQVLVVIPIVLISVVSISLIEAFFILPHHLYHSLEHQNTKKPHPFRDRFDAGFEVCRGMIDKLVYRFIQVRYLFVSCVIALFIVSVSLLSSGVIKFSAFPSVEGDVLEARLIMPTGTPIEITESMVKKLKMSLNQVAAHYNDKQEKYAIQKTTIQFSKNADAFESGPHLATITVDLLTAEERNFSLIDLQADWIAATKTLSGYWQLVIAEPGLGVAGRAIEIRLTGSNLKTLSNASQDLQSWLTGYEGVQNLMDDLRPGKPEFHLRLKEGALSLGLNAQTIASQLRAAYQGSKTSELNIDQETYEVIVQLNANSKEDIDAFFEFPIILPDSGTIIPLSSLAILENKRGFSRIHRIDNQRTVTVIGDVNTQLNNVSALLKNVKAEFIPDFNEKYPDVSVSFKGEDDEGSKTQSSMGTAMLLAIFGVFVLLSFQFKSYLEPIIVMINIPLAFIGVVWGHWLMGLDLTMPSMLGFVSLMGVVVNDSILLVEFVKLRSAQGFSIHEAAAKASHDRFRAVLLTSLTTIAGMTPLLFETSLQAQFLIPLAASIIFGIASSTLLILFVVPCVYSIFEDFGFIKNTAPLQKVEQVQNT